MVYALRDTTMADSLFCYEVKKTVLYEYVKAIWGWDEKVQEDFHRDNFHPGSIRIIIVNGENIGTVEIVEKPTAVFISSLYILPAWQGKGLGTAIIENYIAAANRQSKRVELEVLKLNKDAQRLYSRLGFQLTESDKDKYFMYKEARQ